MWHEYEISVLGDALHAIAELLRFVAVGCGVGAAIVAGVDKGLLPALDYTLPAGFGDLVESGYRTAIWMAMAALALAMIPAELAAIALQRTLLRAMREGAPRTRPPHPLQTDRLSLPPACLSGGITTLIGVLGVGVYLLIQLFDGSFELPVTPLLIVPLAAVVLAIGAYCLNLLRDRPRRIDGPTASKKPKRPLWHIGRYWPRSTRQAILTEAAQAAGYESVEHLRNTVEEDEPSKKMPLPPEADAFTLTSGFGPEWVRRSRPRAQAWFVGAQLVGVLAAVGPLAARTRANPGYKLGEVGALLILIGLIVLLVSHIALIVTVRHERSQVVRASQDPQAAPPGVGPLARHSAPHLLGTARLGAILAGAALPAATVLYREANVPGSFFTPAADALGAVLWISGALFVLSVLAQTLEYHVGRRARNRIMARWPSLWHSKRVQVT